MTTAFETVNFTIGYGGRTPTELIQLLKDNGIRTVVDVRLHPERASMGYYVKAKSPEKGIEKLLTAADIHYLWLVELGNPFMAHADWKIKYPAYLRQEGDAVFHRLEQAERPFALMCAEKKVTNCHREAIAELLAEKGWKVVHIE